MADEFPASLQQFAIPKASDNKAGQKLQQPAPQAQAKTTKKKAAAVMQSAAVKAQQRMQNKPDIHQAIEQVSGGTIQHGKESPYVKGPVNPRPPVPPAVGDTDFDAFAVTTEADELVRRKIDPIELQARRNALLNELGALDDGMQYQDLSKEDAVKAAAASQDIPLNLPKSLAQRARETQDLVRAELAKPTYLSKTTRVMMELTDGTFTIPVTDVKESRLSMLLLLPLHENATIFIPKPGTQLFLTHNNKTTKVYYPGTYVEVPELRTGFMSLIKADAETSEEKK